MRDGSGILRLAPHDPFDECLERRHIGGVVEREWAS
jgi:hypothetical protein